MIFPILINTIILTLLSVLHVHWAFGGTIGWGAAVPTKNDGERIFNPGMVSSLVVAFGLMVFAFIVLGNTGIFSPTVDARFFVVGNWIIAGVFALRAVGDFRFVGFTKKIKDTSFGVNDTRYYSPLCLLIAGLNTLIIIFR